MPKKPTPPLAVRSPCRALLCFWESGKTEIRIEQRAGVVGILGIWGGPSSVKSSVVQQREEDVDVKPAVGSGAAAI